jgi:sigma-B regulation protein RsbU (phosphoserine phosphatase)
VLGLLDAPPPFPTNRLRLLPGEGIVAYTDGVGEAFGPDDALFGVGRLVATLNPLARERAATVTAAVREAVCAFAGDVPQSDDITILTLRSLRRG